MLYMVITFEAVKITMVNNKILELIKDIILVIVIPNILTVSIFRKKDEMIYLKQLMYNIIKK